MAEFYKGFVFERDARGRLTIEGNPVEPGDEQTGSGDAVLSDAMLAERVSACIEKPGWLDARERVKRKHLRELRVNREHWNAWRHHHPEIRPMFAAHDFTEHDAGRVFDGYDFSYTNFTQACLRGMSLKGANFHQAILARANLSDANLEGANFCRTDFYETVFVGAHLKGANLQGVQLSRTKLAGADLYQCSVYGLSAWDADLEGADQRSLLIHYDELVGGQRLARRARVDGIDVASFIYFTLNNKNIARIVEATTKQWVLLLGRFTEHKDVLEALAKALRKKDLIPIIFDFDRARDRDLVESVILLGGLSKFVIVDITDPQSTPLELHAIVPTFAVPVVPIMRTGTTPFGVFSGLLKYPWVRRPKPYDNPADIVRGLDSLIADVETFRRGRRDDPPLSE